MECETDGKFAEESTRRGASQNRTRAHPLRPRRTGQAHQPRQATRQPRPGNPMGAGHSPPLQRNRAGAHKKQRRRVERNPLHPHPEWSKAANQRKRTRACRAYPANAQNHSLKTRPARPLCKAGAGRLGVGCAVGLR